jgi:hypothetical protein
MNVRLVPITYNSHAYAIDAEWMNGMMMMWLLFELLLLLLIILIKFNKNYRK